MSAGVFQTSQPRYAAHRIATFPIGMNKRPAVRGYPRIGLRASAELASKFVDAPALRQISRPISSIHIGTRHRRDLGDIAGLAESIALHALGLLRRALPRDAQGRASTPLDATTASEAMR